MKSVYFQKCRTQIEVSLGIKLFYTTLEKSLQNFAINNKSFLSKRGHLCEIMLLKLYTINALITYNLLGINYE